ncbi:MAG: hypothetical protein NZ822_01505 [Patescibacteria group bacterium]|nr:hypothetical protein [Patescibacteria group bacterium]
MEGPGVKIISEKLKFLENSQVIGAYGHVKKFDPKILKEKEIEKITSYGKLLFIKIKDVGYIKIHFLMYGSYSLDKLTKPQKSLRLAIETKNSKIFFYNCSVDLWQKLPNKKSDILSKKFPINSKVLTLMKTKEYICDILLNQDIFPGVGNIIKVEALFRAKIHPLSFCYRIPAKMLMDLIREAKKFSIIFYQIRKRGDNLRKYLLCYGKNACSNCNSRIIKKRLGNKKRFSFYCPGCQKIFN